ncbi:MAG: tRNA pseudouridine(55) synthase TruB [Flavobacteriales bacterium]|nr:tRNA pseudouridine(55) synthase TruB [Flavobacteriales bacterium]
MKKEFQFIEGEVLCINKPLHWTSFQVVNKLRWLIKRKLKVKKIKVGHAGTLDPLASGLMILCTGKKTKEIEMYQSAHKEYIATIKLGASTPSYDGESAENQFYATQHIDMDLIRQTLASFLGESQQYPPIFSAIKIDGKKLYESARKGKDVELRPRSISIQALELLSVEMPYLTFRVACSKGTYIRSLAHDIGKVMNSGAWLTKLQRTKIGDYELKNALDIQDFELLMKS